MTRPLGLWLPNKCWEPAIAMLKEILIGPAASRTDDGRTVASGQLPSPQGSSLNVRLCSILSSTPWTIALPLQPVLGPSKPLVLLCSSSRQAISHCRAQQQLQQCLMYIYVEGTLTTVLLPVKPLPSPNTSIGLKAQGSQVAAAAADKKDNRSGMPRRSASDSRHEDDMRRSLAVYRLAHMFMVKGAWNKRCFLTSETTEQGPDYQH